MIKQNYSWHQIFTIKIETASISSCTHKDPNEPVELDHHEQGHQDHNHFYHHDHHDHHDLDEDVDVGDHLPTVGGCACKDPVSKLAWHRVEVSRL